MLKANRLQLAKRHFSPGSRAFIAALLMAMVVLLDAMVASPALHELTHKDAGQAAHQCVVTLFAHGQVDAAPVDVCLATSTLSVATVPSFIFSVFAPAIENLPAGRAPPVSAVPLV